MKKNNKRVEWAGCSNYKERVMKARQAHDEFILSELKTMLDNNWKVKQVKKRPRIQKPKTPKAVIVSLWGKWTLKLSWEEYCQRGRDLQVKIKIYE